MSNNQNNQVPEEIEELSEQLSLKLAQKLERHEISIEKMAAAIQSFFYQLHTQKDIEKLKKFVDDF